MPVIDDDPVTPEALHGLFIDAREVGRFVQVFAVAISGATQRHAIDRATLITVETLDERKDIAACAGSITVLMNGETAGVVVAQPQGAPTLKALGEALLKALTGHFAGSGARVAIGMATTAQHKDLDVDDAIAVAMEGLEVASASGSNSAVHSELYELTLATRRRHGTVFPLESVHHFDEDDEDNPLPKWQVPAMTPTATATTAAAGVKGAPEAVPAESRADSPAESREGATNGFHGRAEALGEFDDPFAHLASDRYELSADSAALLTSGIAPQSAAVAHIELESRAEIERLRLELDLARREKAESTATGAAIDKQERRITKLVQQLESAEIEIERLRTEQARDPGVASRFKGVQGLDPAEPKAPIKRVMIDGVFEANQKKPPAP